MDRSKYCKMSPFDNIVQPSIATNKINFIAEYVLFKKDMKMDKQEVKREYKEQEGNPEIKSKRRERIRKFFLSN